MRRARGPSSPPCSSSRVRARSAWQLHKNLFTAPVWDQLHGIENTAIQVRAASDALKRAYFTCSHSGVPWLQEMAQTEMPAYEKVNPLVQVLNSELEDQVPK